MGSWCSAGVNRPILSEIVQPGKRASIVAWVAACEGSSAALFGAPIVGFLAEDVFGYKRVSSSGGEHVHTAEAADAAVRASNRHALSRAMLCGTLPPFLICASLYTLLHWTYARDVRRTQGMPDVCFYDGGDSLPMPSEIGMPAPH